jgi:hypothetical protein
MFNEKLIETLSKENLSLDEYLLIYSIYNNVDYHVKMKIDRMSTYQRLIRRKFIDATNNVLEKGIKVLNYESIQEVEVPLRRVTIDNKKQKLDESFLQFWKTFPTSDKFKQWPRTRTLRANRAKAYRLYSAIVESGEFTPEDLLYALNEDLKVKRESSITRNNLTYMQAICTWLNKRIFEGFLEDKKETNIQNELKRTGRRYGEDIE